MQLVCPHCGEPVPSENINIQRMAAVCPACNTVFQFDVSDSKIKRRKVKQPQHITSDETDGHLNIAFRTNFRLDQNEYFIGSALSSVVFTIITIVFIGIALAKPASTFLALGSGLLTLCLYYWLALVAYNKTHIEVSDEQLMVSRKPLPNIFRQPHTIERSGIENVRYEETAASKKEGYDTPRYNVWAEMVDGNHKLVVSDVVEDYAVFISQRLNEYLDLDAAPDVSRPLDDEGEVVDEAVSDEMTSHAKSSHNGR
jgi:hypothetical protein